LRKFIKEDVRGAEESDLGVGWPSLNEVTDANVAAAHVLHFAENTLHYFCYLFIISVIIIIVYV